MKTERVNKEKARTEKAGFTLLEVMVAVAIMGIVLVAVFKLHAQTISMSGTARFYASAPFLAREAVSELILKPASELGGAGGDFGEGFAGYVWSAEVADVESEFLGETAERLKRIDVTVTYAPEGLSYGFRTYRMYDE